MILISDSGSTGTDWVSIEKDKQVNHYKTAGFNPYYSPKNEIIDILEKELVPYLDHHSVRYIYYYGSGCSTEKKRFIVEDALEQVFPHASIDVQHDLLGAARGLFNRESGIACILGTGSNSCLYDGNEITENISSLGYIFGDEGSGAHIGKLFLTAYLKKELPVKISKKFHDKFSLNLENILDSAYNQPRPSAFLASFMEFIGENKKDPYVHHIIFTSFDTLFQEYIVRYTDYEEHNIACVGSVAYYFRDYLEMVAKQYDCNISKILQNPMEGLIEYHMPDVERYAAMISS
jgi:N-acetylglucosamine kinase-like BadF-type ATPase